MSYINEQNISVGAFLAAVAGFKVVSWRESILKKDRQSYICKDISIPSDCIWLDQSSYQVLAAICDTLVPSYHINLDCSNEQLQHELMKISTELPDCCPLNMDTLLQYREHLLRGAIGSNTHNLVADALQNFSYKFDQTQLFILLKILGTSLGCLLVCGIPAPYHMLSLRHREVALRRIRDSPLPDIRAAYQNFKRLTGNIFNAYAERGRLNTTWEALSYNPHNTVNKPPPSLQILDDDTDTMLRRKINYQSVLAELKNEVDEDTDVLNVDVVVVGSGAGGGTVASQLVLAGFDVLVLEKGGYFRADDFRNWRESEAMQHIYERSGLCTSADGNIVVLAGSCVGGGSTVNWSASFRTPQPVRDEWVAAGLSDFRQGGDFDASLDAVHSLINVNSKCSHRTAEEDAAVLCEDSSCAPFAVNGNNQLLWQGAEKLGYRPEKIPRNVKQCVDCGHCTHGCAYESKQSTITAMMEPLVLQQERRSHKVMPHSRGRLHIVPNCQVDRVLYEVVAPTESSEYGDYRPSKRAVGVEGVVTLYPEADLKARTRAAEGCPKKLTRPTPIGTRKVRVNAHIVVASAGAIHTPALLLRSGFNHPEIGKYLTLHTVMGAGGMFPKDIHTGLGSGVSMGVVVRSPAITANTVQNKGAVRAGSVGISGKKDSVFAEEEAYSVAIETPPVHPGLLGLMLPWDSGMQFKIRTLGYKNIAIFIGVSRDRSQRSNCISLNAQGQPVIHYKVTAKDVPVLMAGFEANLRLMYAAGARIIFTGHENYPWFVRSEQKDDAQNAAAFEAYLAGVLAEGVQASKTQLFSAHQMSSCRMAASPAAGCTRPNGELYECSHLYLADASVFPTALGINPMVTVEAMAHMIARKIVAKVSSSHDTSEDAVKLRTKVLNCERAKKNQLW